MGCNCGKPKCDGQCGCKSPAVLQINNPPEYITFHKVSVPAVMGDSKTNPPAIGKYKNVLLYYEADQTSWLYSTDGIPTKLTNGITNYEDAINLPQINGHTLLGNQSSSDLGLQGELTAGANIQINDNVISATDTTYTAGNGIELDGTEIKAKIGDGLEFDGNGEIDIADIEQYAHFFDTVASMKNTENLVNGSFAQTLGYYAKNDGGGALYKIRNITNDDVVDEATIIEMGDGSNELIAELIIGDSINAKQFGAKGDNTTDDTLKIQNLINKGQSFKKRVILNDGYYKVSGLSITLPVTIECVEQTAKLISISDAIPVITINQNGGQTLYERTVISGVEIDANGQEGVHITSGNVRVDKNTRILNASYGINVAGGNLYADDIRVEYCTTGIKLSTSDNHLNNITTHNCATHYRNYGGYNICKNIHGWNFNENDTDYVSGAEFMRVNTAQTQIINCYVDTLPKAFIVENTSSQYVCIDIQNLNFFLNVTSYPNTQAKPELINNFAGKLNINSCLIDYNGYVGDGSGNIFSYPSNVRITNFASNGVKFDQNYYYKTEITPSASYSDDGSDFIINNSTYLSGNYRKLIADGKSRFLDLKFNLKTSLTANTEIYNATFKHKMTGLDGMLITCYGYSGSTYYPLQAFIEDDTLHIYNAGSTISRATAVQLRGILQKV